jgi:adenylate cyclase
MIAVGKEKASKVGRPLHLHISFIFGSLFLVLALTLVAFAYVNGRATALSQASNLVDAKLDNLVSRSVGQLAEVEAVVAALASNSRLAVAGRGDPTGKFVVLRDTLSRLPIIDGLYVGYPNGDFAHLVSLEREAWKRTLAAPDEAKYAFRIISAAPNGSRSSVWQFFGPDGVFLSQTDPANTDYDPRVRQWFRLAKANSGIAWTPAYIFATTKQIGFTVSSIMRDLPGAVVAADITLQHMGEMFEQQKITPGTRVMLFDGEGGLLAFSGMGQPRLTGKTAREDEPGLTIERDPLAQEVYRRSTDLGSSPVRSFSFEMDKTDYIATVKSAQPSPGHRLFMAMATPVSELTADVRRTNLRALIISGLIAAMSLPIVVFAARKLSRPLRRLSAEARKIEAFDLVESIPIRSRISEVRELEEAMSAAKMGLRTFGLYVPIELVRQILQSGVSPTPGGERRNLTVMFSDIQDFTSIAEVLEPEDLTKLLSEYFEIASRAIHGNGGSINKFIGDGVLAIWNAPKIIENHEVHACRCAIEFQNLLSLFNKRQQSKGEPPLNTRIGIHTGIAVVGNVGTAERLEYTALGDMVNVAARLEQLNKNYGTQILVSSTVKAAVADTFNLRPMGEVSLKGRKQPVQIFELSQNH